MKNTVKNFINKHLYHFELVLLLFITIMIELSLVTISEKLFMKPQTREEHAVYHRQGILQTDDGNFWEIDCDLTPASEYIAIFNDNGTKNDITDDYIEHLVQIIF